MHFIAEYLWNNDRRSVEWNLSFKSFECICLTCSRNDFGVFTWKCSHLLHLKIPHSLMWAKNLVLGTFFSHRQHIKSTFSYFWCFDGCSAPWCFSISSFVLYDRAQCGQRNSCSPIASNSIKSRYENGIGFNASNEWISFEWIMRTWFGVLS